MRNNSQGIPFVVCAPSGAGKTTLVNKLLADFQNFKFSLSYTTREPRSDERQGSDYYFVSVQEFLELVEQGFFAEWAQVHSNYYGTPHREVSKITDRGLDILFDIDIQGARQLRKNLEKGVFLFILPPSREVLQVRIQNRGTDSREVIQERLQKARQEIEYAFEFDYLIVNRDLNRAYDQLRSIYTAEKAKTYYNQNILETILENWDN